MKRDIPLKEVIEQLREYPEDAKITVFTKEEMKIIGFVLQKKNGSRQIVEIARAEANRKGWA